MKHFSNRYIFIFSAVMVIIVATILSMAATLLRPLQEKNLEVARKRSMLESINIPADRKNAEELYSKYIKESFVLDSRGERKEGIDAFNVEMRTEQKKPLDEQALPVFYATLDDGDKVIILPLEGKGLWGPIWGFISLKKDMNTIYGVTFDHKGETPGLGAEISTTPFESQFRNEQLFDNGTFVSVKVQKRNEKPVPNHSVDAISGGTITSKALQSMLYDCLVKYENYLKKNAQ
jgi:Na+-transporting NADH:ubiquinone oxidoreductase subunit C